MNVKDNLQFYVRSKWGVVQSNWEGTMRSNSMFRVLDLDVPGTFGFHMAYHPSYETINYILITLDAGVPDSDWIYNDEDYTTSIENFETHTRVTIYRRSLENNGAV